MIMYTHFDLSGAEIGIFPGKLMQYHGYWQSANMVLIMQDKLVLVFHKEGFHTYTISLLKNYWKHKYIFYVS